MLVRLDYQVCCYTISYELFECILPGLCVGGGTLEGRVKVQRATAYSACKLWASTKTSFHTLYDILMLVNVMAHRQKNLQSLPYYTSNPEFAMKFRAITSLFCLPYNKILLSNLSTAVGHFFL